jgi:hypothetical protein
MAWKVLLLWSLVRLSVATTSTWHGDRLGFGGRQPAGLLREWALLARSGLGGGAVPDHFAWLRDPGAVVERLSSAW